MALTGQDFQAAQATIRALTEALNRVVVGKSEAIKLALTAILAGGHLLIEDVPGTGKTVLARALAQALELHFRRVQFTPDLLPGDLTGVSIFDPKDLRFEFRPGPVFTDILLADEINRATPRAQAALLECMAERQVTSDGETRSLSAEFFVIATQNPIELQGTFPLPEAQLDRFALSLSLGHPERAELESILAAQRFHHPLEDLKPVAHREQLAQARRAAAAVEMDSSVEAYALDIALATRSSPRIALGASTRAVLIYVAAARAYALISGRHYVLPDDLKALARPVLAHRLVLDGQARIQGRREGDVLAELLESIPAPVAPVPGHPPPGP